MSECREFQGFKDKDNYGKVSFMGKVVRAHRLSYCQSKGIGLSEIEGKVVMHSCDNPACTNPDHLSLGTTAENVADMMRKGRHGHGSSGVPQYGEKNGRAKLSLTDVHEIRSVYVAKCAENGGRALARRFGVDPKAIRCVLNGESWAKYPSNT